MLSELFEPKFINYDLRMTNLLPLPPTRDTNSWVLRGVLIWNNPKNEAKRNSSVAGFQQSLENKNLYCQCKICS